MNNTILNKLFYFGIVWLFTINAGSYASAQDDSWQVPPDEVQKNNPVNADKESIKRGRRLFLQNCSSCHGDEGRGDGPVAIRLITEPPDLSAIGNEQTDGELAWKIATGRNPMPKWKDILSSDQIWDLVNFMRNLPGDSD